MAQDASDPPKLPKGQIPTNLRLLLLAEAVAEAGRPLGPVALAQALDLPKPTIHRLLNTAEEQGYLQRDVDGRGFGPGPRLRKLAANTLSSDRVRSERLSIMRALSEEVGETVNLAAPGRRGMVYLDRVETHWPLRIQLPRGTQVPFHCTASGKMYLSSMRNDKLERWLLQEPLDRHTRHTITDSVQLRKELAGIAARGYSLDDQEFMEDMAALAVALRDDTGRLLCTLSIHVPVLRHDITALLQFLPALRGAAAQMEALIEQS